MNSERIVSVLLGEADLTPAEFVRSVPEIFVRYEFDPTPSFGMFNVKRWSEGRGRNIGVVWHDEEDDLWMATKVAPSGRHIAYWYPTQSDAPVRHTREEAAKDLWRLYYKALKDGTIHVSS